MGESLTSLSVLQNARKSDVRAYPFPHIILDNAIPKDLYEELVRSFPSPELMGFSRGRK